LCPECGAETLTKDVLTKSAILDIEGDDRLIEHRRVCPSCEWREVTYD